MKKFLSILLSVIIFVLVCVPALAADNTDKTLRFDSNGNFKIMMMNDTQDIILKDVASAALVKKAVAKENPNLIVMTGDQITDFFPGATHDALIKCLTGFMDVIAETGVPFVVTFGNHDHDWEKILSLEEQMSIYKSYKNCYVVDTGCDLGTYNIPIMSSDGSKIAFNIYVFDTHNKAPEGLITGYEGIRANQLQWYKDTSNSLKAQNSGKSVASLVFQHIPVKEIYQFLDTVPMNGDLSDAIFSLDNKTWYKLNSHVIDGVIGEVPCSEALGSNTGEYQAWVEQGDIVGAYFGHDHVNNFVGVTDDGIKMGYNGGTGFSTYGRGGDRSVRIFEINENEPENYTTREVTFNQMSGLNINFFITDLFSPVLVTVIAKFLVNLLPQFARDIIVNIAGRK
jgi:hypothetical protein